MRNNKERSIEALVVLTLLVVLATCIITVLMMGAKVYQKLAHRDFIEYNDRTIAQYIITKIHQNDAEGMIGVARFNWGDTLVFREDEYITYIYAWEGNLYELYCGKGTKIEPGLGENIMPAKSMKIEVENGLLSIYIETENGVTIVIDVNANSKIKEIEYG